MKHLISKVYLLLALFILSACSFNYKFSGASISDDVKTYSVNYFQYRAPTVIPTFSQEFTEALKDKFQNETRLRLVNSDGDFHFEGEVTGYRLEPRSIQDDAQAAQTRLTMTIKVRFSNSKDSEKDFESSFSAFADYTTDRSYSDVEQELTETIIEQIVEDIFNKTAADW